MRLFLSACLFACVLLAAPLQAADASAEARALFDDYWEWVLREYPDAATLYFGDNRHDDRLRDESAAAVRARTAAYARFAESAARIDAAQLSREDLGSLGVLRFQLDRILKVTRQFGALPFGAWDDWSPVTQMDGIHLRMPQLMDAARFHSAHDYEKYLKRLEEVPRSVAHLIERMQTAIEAGWMPARIAIERVPGQIDVQLVADARQSPQYAPFKSFPADIAPAERERLAAAGLRAIADRVIPAFRTLKTFYESSYLPAARERLGVSSLPPGAPYYQALLDSETTTTMTPRQIHELGLQEVRRVGAEMDRVVSAIGFKGTRGEFQTFITADPRFFFTKPEAMLAAYRDIAKRADAELPKLFAELPRQPYGIRAMRPEQGNNAEQYMPGAQDGSRPGWFEANVNDLKTRPKWIMESLLLHETVPGHHLQIARAQEMMALPAFRRHAWFTAFGEGWALYAEGLGDEMGFYKDPYQKFGNLSFEMLRACRLVVDTGLHAFDWTRDRAIDYMVANTGMTRDEVIAEVDRYIVWPGQATAYKIGEMKIKALRAKAKSALGERFDLRRFHNAVIDNGTVPLAVLEQQIDEWITAEKAR